MFILLSRVFGLGYGLSILVVCFELLRRGESPWLLPAMIGGSAMLVALPSLALVLWGRAVLKRSPGEQQQVKRAIAFAAAPLVIGLVSFVVGFIVVLVAPPGMTTRPAG